MVRSCTVIIHVVHTSMVAVFEVGYRSLTDTSNMEELPPQLSVSDSVPTLVQTVTTLPSEQQHRKQSHGPVVVGDLGGLAGGQLQGVVTSGGSLLDSGVRMRARGHLETLGETLSSHPAFCDPKDQQNQVLFTLTSDL